MPIAAMLVPLWAKDFIANTLAISGKTRVVAKFTANLVFLFAAMVAVIGICNRIAVIITTRSQLKPKGLDSQFIRLVFRVIGFGAAAGIFLEGGRYLGIPMTTLLAGAGVGGLALALSAQDTLKNIFGSVMIILDRPYQVGERVVAKGYDGVVEEIGLRSTKIRLLTGHQTSIPNEDMARSDIESIGRRPYIRRITDIALPIDTPPDKAERAARIVRSLLEDHEGRDPAFPPRVYLNDFNRDSLNLRMIYWFHPPNYWDFLAQSEKLNLEIKRRFAAEGIELALPATATHVKQKDERPLELRLLSDPHGPTPH
jgi:MscS family membrane protein